MNLLFRIASLLLAPSTPLIAGTVVITSLPDNEHPLDPLASLNGIPLVPGVEVRVGAFPGFSDDALLNAAATGGFAQISAAFVPFGEPKAIGEGVDGAAGSFEISVRKPLPNAEDPLAGETVSLVIKPAEGGEFFIARFPGNVFEADSETGLEPLLSLHLAEAKVIVGNRYGRSKFVTSPAPETGTYALWIAGFTEITDPEKRVPEADADGDGRSNFLEYATGGNPASAGDAPPCQIHQDSEGVFWLKFSRAAGLGSIRYTLETTGGFANPWQEISATVEPDPAPPVAGGNEWMRIRIPAPLDPSAFFRLNADEEP